MDFILCFQQQLLLAVLAAADGLVDQPGGLLLGGADFPFADLLAVQHAAKEEPGSHNQIAQNDENDLQRFHKSATHLLLNDRQSRRGGAKLPLCKIGKMPGAIVPGHDSTKKRQKAQYAKPFGFCPIKMKRSIRPGKLRTPYHYYFTCPADNCQAQFAKTGGRAGGCSFPRFMVYCL